MCDPGTAIAVASLAIGVASEAAHASADNKAAAANKKSANTALTADLNALTLQKAQVQDASTTTIMQADRQARQADALTKLSAGEAGVAGASVDALVGDIDSQLGTFKTTESRNLKMTLDQIDRKATGAEALAESRIAAVPGSNPFATSLAIAGHGIDFANTIRQRKPTK